MIRIRPLRGADMVDVLRIQAQCYFAIVPESHASLLAKISACPATCFAAEAQGAMAGYIVAVPVVHPRLPRLDAPAFVLEPAADTLYLHDLAVGTQGRGTGAGAALARAALDAGRALGLARACLVAIQDSAPYWRRFGFDEVVPPPGLAAKLASYGAGARLMQAPL